MDDEGLSEPQFVQFNGGFSQEQLNWLNEVLTFSDKNQEKVVIVIFSTKKNQPNPVAVSTNCAPNIDL